MTEKRCDCKVRRVVYPFDEDFNRKEKKGIIAIEVCRACGKEKRVHKDIKKPFKGRTDDFHDKRANQSQHR